MRVDAVQDQPASNRVRRTDASQPAQKKTGKAALLEWCQRMAGGKYDITNFSGSFADGLAFCAIMYKVRRQNACIFPPANAVPGVSNAGAVERVVGADAQAQLHARLQGLAGGVEGVRVWLSAPQLAADAGVDPLLDVEDMVEMERPDPLSVMTYCNFLFKKFGDRAE